MPRVAALLAGLAVVLLVLGIVLQAANGPLPGPTDESWTLVPLAVGFPVVGAVIARRQPGHPIAWIFLGCGLVAGLAAFAYPYSKYALTTRPGTVPLGMAVAWVSEWAWTTGGIPLLTFGLLLFPDGHLPSRRWRPVAWLAGATLAMFAFGTAFHTGPLANHPTIANPAAIDAAEPLFGVLQPLEDDALGLIVVEVDLVLQRPGGLGSHGAQVAADAVAW